MNRWLMIACVSAAAFACTDDDNDPADAGSDAGPADAGTTDAGSTDAGSTDAGTTDAGTTDGGSSDAGTDAGTPAVPALGTTQIDRMGRAAVNTALTAPFVADATAAGNKKDAYNAAKAPADWAAFSSDIRSNLAVLDGLDAVCGNQLAADLTGPRYSALTTAFVADELSVNTATGTCTQYLAVELAATGALPGATNDCGGRTPTYDTIDVTYSETAIGATTGVTDGIDSDTDGAPSTTSFPFLRAP